MDKPDNPPLYAGMTKLELRDLFAAFALAGLMAARAFAAPSGDEDGLSQASYEVADAMLKERAK